MKSLLLLKDPKFCPRCRRKAVATLPSVCRCCEVMLFDRHDNFMAFQDETGIREYYVFTKDNGWMHSTQVNNPNPNSREYVTPKLADDYGKKSHEQMAAEAIAEERAKL